MKAINRIHHITAIVGHPQTNYDFYHGVLGLNLIKQTVNFDDTGVYHLYFGDEEASKGFVLTFFPWPHKNAQQGELGGGQVGTIAFKVAKGSLSAWQTKLNDHKVETVVTEKFDRPTLEFNDPHGLSLAMVEADDQVANQTKVLGFYGVELHSRREQETKDLMENVLQIPVKKELEDAFLLETQGDEHHVIRLNKKALPLGTMGVGTVHHIAWSIPTFEEQKTVQKELSDLGFGVTEVKDRNYFKAVYSREKGGILFEYATDEPGFTVDEPLEDLGNSLKLPDQYEDQRAKYETELPPLNF